MWCGFVEIPKQGKVNWRKVCSSKKEGGLALKDPKTWNKIYGLKLIW